MGGYGLVEGEANLLAYIGVGSWCVGRGILPLRVEKTGDANRLGFSLEALHPVMTSNAIRIIVVPIPRLWAAARLISPPERTFETVFKAVDT